MYIQNSIGEEASSYVDSIALRDEVTSGEASPATTNPSRVVTLPFPNTTSDTPSSHDSLQAQSELFESDDDYLDSLFDNDVPAEIQDFIIKMGDVDYRLFEYRIVNLSETNLVDPVNKVFSDDDKKRMRRLWEEVCITLAIKLNCNNHNLIYPLDGTIGRREIEYSAPTKMAKNN